MSGSGLLSAASNKGRAESKGAAQADTSRVQFKLEIIAPPAELAGLINTFYVIETAEPTIEEVVPAYSAQLIVMIRGSLVIHELDGVAQRAQGIAINAPQLKSTDCVLEGPVMLIGASLTALGWQALSNLPADEVHDRLLPPETIFTDTQIAALETAAAACAAGRITARDLSGQIAELIAAPRFALRPDHVAFVEAMMRWLGSGLDPSLDELYGAVGISQRQTQRLSRRYFGVPPAQVLKRFRAIRAAMVLANPTLPDTLRAKTLSTGLLDPSGHGEAAELLRPGSE